MSKVIGGFIGVLAVAAFVAYMYSMNGGTQSGESFEGRATVRCADKTTQCGFGPKGLTGPQWFTADTLEGCKQKLLFANLDCQGGKYIECPKGCVNGQLSGCGYEIIPCNCGGGRCQGAISCTTRRRYCSEV